MIVDSGDLFMIADGGWRTDFKDKRCFLELPYNDPLMIHPWEIFQACMVCCGSVH